MRSSDTDAVGERVTAGVRASRANGEDTGAAEAGVLTR
jgi:hypothetical protein